MLNLLNRGTDILQSIRKLDTDQLLYRNLPQLVMEFMKTYFRLEINGLENIPRRGPAIITPNHSGYAGFDALMLSYEISKKIQRIPRVLTHHLWFANQATAVAMHKMGFVEARFNNGNTLLSKNNLVMLFPEGESGNFKPTSKMYQVQEFKTGFIRLALLNDCPIIPCLIIGAEESHINLKKIHLPKFLKNIALPLPLNVIPLPVKWRIKILEPIHLPYGKEALDDPELIYELADDIRTRMQGALNEELKQRQSIFY